MRLLLVEDDDRTAAFVRKGLTQEGYLVERASNGEEGLFMAQHGHFDAAIVDIMLPKMDGLKLIENLRASHIKIPLIVLSAKKSVEDRIRGLHSGGDDYLVKPFAFAELLARIQALMRRVHNVAEPTSLKVADLSLDIAKRKVTRAGIEIDLQQREFALLEYLMRNQGRVVSKTMIMENVWGYDFDPVANVVETRICRLREKVDRNFSPKLVHTIRGAGYLLEPRT